MASSGNKKKHSPRQKENYKAYAREMKWKKNRKKRLLRHINKFPNDTKAVSALENLSGARESRSTRRSMGHEIKQQTFKDMKVVDTRESFRQQLINLKRKLMESKNERKSENRRVSG